MAFSIESKSEHGFETIILRDQVTQTFVEIIPACGAILHGFSILKNGKFINLIEHYENKNDFKNNVENKGFKSCKLSPFACRVKDATYNWQQQQYLLNKFMLGKNALHGLLYDAEFIIIKQSATTQQASIELLYQYQATENGYPFKYDCTICYRLLSGNCLVIETKITNKSEINIPLQDGWHPYFCFDKPIDSLQLQLNSLNKIELDADLIPTGRTMAYSEFEELKKIESNQFDDCFEIKFIEGEAACVLKDEEQDIKIEIFPDKSYPYLQLFTPQNRKSIAIENLSAIPDCFNNQIGLITLSPQTTKIFSTTYKVTY